MEQNNHTNGHGFGNGFILGLLVGIVATLLLTTKKGREILHELTEKGLDRFSDIEARLQETATKTKSEIVKTQREYDELEEEEGDFLPEEPLPVKLAEEISESKETHHEKEHRHEHSHPHHHHDEHEEGHKSNGSRRFFKKRAN